AELAGQARQEPGRADVGEEADADLRHGELETVARDPVRAVDRHADAAAHDDAVDQRDVWLGVMLDRRVERVLVAPEVERLLVLSGTPEIVEPAQVAARRERPLARRPHAHAGARPVAPPLP